MAYAPIKTPSGSLINFGADRQRLSWRAIDGAAPAWLTLPAGTLVAATDDRPHHSYTFASTGPANYYSSLFKTDRISAMMLTARGIETNGTTSVQFRLAPADPGSPPNREGVITTVPTRQGLTAYHEGRYDEKLPSVYSPANGSRTGLMDMSNLWVRGTGTVYQLEGSSVVSAAYLGASLIVPSSIRPTITVYGNASNTVKLGGFDVTVWYD